MVIVIDVVGNISVVFEICLFIIDIMVFVVFVIDMVYDGMGFIIGNLSLGQIIDEVCFVISGICEVNIVICFYDNGMLLVEIFVDNSSSWCYMFDVFLVMGNYVIIVIVVDVVGNVSFVLDSVNFVVDIMLLLMLVIILVSDDQVSGFGMIVNG